MGETYYDILGVARTCSQSEIKQAYFRLARQYHPDSNPSITSTDFFLTIQKAFEVLGNPKKRRQYDELEPIHVVDVFPGRITNYQSASLIDPEIESQLLYSLLEIETDNSIENSTPTPVHLCFVIDRSTSMKGNRIRMVVDSISNCLKSLEGDNTISIIAFNDNAEIILAPTTSKNVNSIIKKLELIDTTGGTEMFSGLETGLNFLWHGRGEDHARHLLLFTDGRTYGDEEKSINLAKKAASQGVKITTLGLGNEWNDVFLEKLANITGGQSFFIQTTDDFRDFFNSFLNTVSTEVAHGISCEFVHDRRVVINYVYRVHPEITNLPVHSPMIVGNLLKKHKTSLLFCFQVTGPVPIGDEIILLDGYLHMKIKGEATRLVNEKVNIRAISNNQISDEEPPVELLKALSLVTLYQMQEKARNNVQVGEISKAVKQLGQIATRFFAQGNNEMAEIILHEADQLKRSNSYSADGEKRIKYGTRSLLQLPEFLSREE